MSTRFTYFISGHLSLSQAEFEEHYQPQIDEALEQGHSFVMGDARGADNLAQQYLFKKTTKVVVYHMFDSPRHNAGFPTVGGFQNDEERDEQMTKDSDHDIAWVREGRKGSGTEKNLRRRGSNN